MESIHAIANPAAAAPGGGDGGRGGSDRGRGGRGGHKKAKPVQLVGDEVVVVFSQEEATKANSLAVRTNLSPQKRMRARLKLHPHPSLSKHRIPWLISWLPYPPCPKKSVCGFLCRLLRPPISLFAVKTKSQRTGRNDANMAE
ncbi:hypothetical protein DTO217A2_7885 [Paecilomyces variotii]|nr:hypothetical protein DTO217A2_7885 [Paecilomyces variotii]KAJ9395776.1 hypothetical protein DTO282F9_7265 [Paecilomyces variotii]